MSSTSTALVNTAASAVQRVGNQMPLMQRPSNQSSSQSTTSSQQQRPPSSQPATPQKQLPRLPSQPGTWRHPDMDAIARRQSRTVFGSENAWSAVKNAILLLVSLTSPALASSLIPAIDKVTTSLDPYYAYTVLAIRLFFLANFIYAFRPFIQPKDEIEDIPLTPSQRALLGLKPSNTPLTPGSQIVTPPRYSRSATPSSSASKRPLTGSPLSGSPLAGRDRSGSLGRSISQRTASGSLYGGSPLAREALTGSGGRRLSFDVSRGEGGSSSSGLPSIPTPIVGTGRASVGLNNKWLYQHSKGSPSGRNLFN